MTDPFDMSHLYLFTHFSSRFQHYSVHRGFDDFLKELKTYRADMESTSTTPRSGSVEKPAKIERSKTEYKTDFKPASRCKYDLMDSATNYRSTCYKALQLLGNLKRGKLAKNRIQ